MQELYFTREISTVLQDLQTTPDGLSAQEVERRFQKYGANHLPEGKKTTLLKRFLLQFKNVMVLVLLAAGIVSGLVGELGNTIVILLVVILNAVLGVAQESKAERSLEALASLSAPKAKILRDGTIIETDSASLVPGDIILLETGSTIPADCRLIETAGLKIEEAALTGESVPSEKTTAVISNPQAPLGDRKNMAYSSSHVVYGRGIGVVTATGADTEVGKIAGHLQNDQEPITPLQKRLTDLSKTITKGVIAIAVLVLGIGLLWGRPLLDMFMIAVSLAVSAIPEGLPAVVTILLALGVQRMAKQNAIIRRLSAVETLGCTQIICSDKTGTLTQNKMTVQKLYTQGHLLPASEIVTVHEAFMQGIALCNDVALSDNRLLGDPTETALVFLVSASRKAELSLSYPRVAELPFDSERKLMSTAHQQKDGIRILTKGAPDILLTHCSHWLTNTGVKPLIPEDRAPIQEQIRALSQEALRVLAFAYKDISELPDPLNSENIETELIFLGLTGMIDPPRPEVKDAVTACKKAGITPIMITGDHLDTAVAIAKDLGIMTSTGQAITGDQLATLNNQQLFSRVTQYQVYARVAPEHKVRIVKAWQKHNKVVAMTGDGVNDAPALKIADIGIGMGITGTDVSKSVSAMILTDDHFATIVQAVKEGRTIYRNIQRAIQFLLSTNLGEVIFLFIGTLLNFTVLLPIHILWINLVTDTFPALALGFEKESADLMDQPPRSNNASFLSGGIGSAVLYQGVISGLLAMAVFLIGVNRYDSQDAMSMAFLAVGAVCLFHSFNLRSNSLSLMSTGISSNKYLLLAFIASAVCHTSVLIIPPLRDLFQLTALNAEQWLITIGIALLIIPIVELVKTIQRKI